MSRPRLVHFLPNLITLARLLAVPVMVYLILIEAYGAAFWLFALAGLSDALDGALAKRFALDSRLGAFLDPLADKSLLVSVFICLSYQDAIAAWLVILIVFRDLLILVGAVLIHTLTQRLTMAPHFVSKVNTACQIVLAALVLADLGLEVDLPSVRWVLVYLVAGTTLLSGSIYVIKWGGMAMSYEDEP